MYQVLIVDDEYLAQNKLLSIIRWEDNVLHIAGTVDNGKDAVSFLNNNHIDVIFTDVCMPLMNGIELTEYVKNNFPHIKIIVLSSYNDYEYVRESFRNKALDYIMKHTINESTVINLLKSIAAELSGHNSADSSDSDYLSKEKQYRSDIISAILEASPTENQYINAIVATVKISNYALLKQIHSQNEFQILYQYITNTLCQFLKSLPDSVVFNDKNDYFIIYMPFGNSAEMDIMKILKSYIKQINYSVRKFFDFRLLWGISCVSTPTYHISDCYPEAVNMLEFSPIKDHENNYTDLEFSSLSVKNEKALLFAISRINKENIDSVLDKIVEDISDNSHAINIITGELIAVANKICEEYRINIESLDYIEKFSLMPKTEISKEDLSIWFKELFRCIIDICIKQNKEFHETRYSNIVKEFVRNNYKNNITFKQL